MTRGRVLARNRYSQAHIDRKVARLREASFTGEIEEMLVQRIIISPPPMDRNGNIIGPAPDPYVWEPTES